MIWEFKLNPRVSLIGVWAVTQTGGVPKSLSLKHSFGKKINCEDQKAVSEETRVTTGGVPGQSLEIARKLIV